MKASFQGNNFVQGRRQKATKVSFFPFAKISKTPIYCPITLHFRIQVVPCLFYLLVLLSVTVKINHIVAELNAFF